MAINMVVFDMAGTVVDEDNIVYKTLRDAINDDGFAFDLDTVLAIGAGKEKLQATRDILTSSPGAFSEERAIRIHSDFVIRLAQAYDSMPIKQQPGAEELFAMLHQHNVLVVLNTGYSRAVAEDLIQKLGWHEGKEIDALVTASDTSRNRPWPDMIELAMRRLNVEDAQTVIKVGDSIIDIEEGKNAGCKFSVGITTGAHTKAQLETAKPDFIIDSLTEVLDIIKS